MDNLFVSQAELDFHLYGELLPYDVEKLLTEFIEDCYMRNYKQVLVITGKGQVVRPLVQKLLPKMKYVIDYKSAGYYNGQSGAFEITLQ